MISLTLDHIKVEDAQRALGEALKQIQGNVAHQECKITVQISDDDKNRRRNEILGLLKGDNGQEDSEGWIQRIKESRK